MILSKKKSEVDLHTTFTRSPTENPITLTHAPFEPTQLLSETLPYIINSIEYTST